MKISLIIPCYNEELSLNPLYEELKKVSGTLSNYEFEYIFVDDGSKDKTLDIIKGFATTDKRVKYISFSKNFGKEAAMFAGFCNSTGDYTAVMDADMQDPPSLLPSMIEILKNGEYDSVATRRVTRKGEPPVRSFFAKAFYRIFNYSTKVNIVSGARDFRLMKREMVDAIVQMCEHNRFSKGIFGWIGFKTYWMPFQNVERVAGQSKWSFKKLLKYSLDGIMAFSDDALKLPYVFSGLSAFASLFPLAYFIYHGVEYGYQAPSPAVTGSIVLFSLFLLASMTLLSLGIVGSYLAKVYGEVKGRPHYIVAQTNKKDVVKK